MNNPSPPLQDSPSDLALVQAAPAIDRQAAAHRSTWVSVWVNIVLVILQVWVGITARSQALVADGLHSLSDLVSDFVVLVANRSSHKAPDEDHHYGHARFETLASLWLGLILVLVGVGMLWRAGNRLAGGDPTPAVHIIALWVALGTLLAKELLFRYLLRIAHQVGSSMLVANAWHARSDAASSLVVAAGIGGNLLGYGFLDTVAALLVGFMIARMGASFAFTALRDLSDRALEPELVAQIQATLAATPGVQGVYAVRTRKMGDLALIDAHVLVLPTVSVSEGHYLAEAARQRVLAAHPVLDILVHIDPEDEREHAPHWVGDLPDRFTVEAALLARLGTGTPHPMTLHLHYLQGQIALECVFPHPLSDAQSAHLGEVCAAWRTEAVWLGPVRAVIAHQGHQAY